MVFDVLALFSQFEEWVSSDWSYAVIFLVAAIDGFFPLVPSETVAITGGVLAGSGELSLPLVMVCAAAGAIVGDNIAYGIGHFFGEHTVKNVFKGDRSARAFRWAEHQLATRGTYIIIVGRFIPGGRLAVNFSSGYIHAFPYRRFLVADVIAGCIWGAYTGALGYFGGKQFEEAPWKGLLLAFAVAIVIAGTVELVRHLRDRRKGTAPPDADA